MRGFFHGFCASWTHHCYGPRTPSASPTSATAPSAAFMPTVTALRASASNCPGRFQTKWHLLKLFRVPMFSDERACNRARLGKQWIGFRSSFETAGLDTAGTLTEVLLGDKDKQAKELVVVDSVNVARLGELAHNRVKRSVREGQLHGVCLAPLHRATDADCRSQVQHRLI